MVDGPVSNRRFSRRQIRSALIIGGGFVAVLMLAVGSWFFYSSNSELASQETQKQLEEFAAQQAQQISQTFADIDRKLAALSKDSAVIALFTEADEAKLASAAESRKNQFNSALKLRFMLPGNNRLDKDSIPPLGYGSLELIRRAETSAAAIDAEVHFFGGPDQHIVMLKRVVNEAGEIIGFIHLSLNVDLIAASISNLNHSDDVYLELSQGADDKAIILAKRGNSELRVGDAVNASVGGSRWGINLWSNSGDLASLSASGSSSNLTLIGMIMIGIIGLIVIALLFVKRSATSTKKKSSAIVYAGAVKAIMDGAHPGMEKMVPNLPNSAEEEGVAESPVEDESEQLADDITMMIKQEDLKAAAAETEMFDLTQAETPAEPVSPVKQAEPLAEAKAETPEVSASIFRAYDIRGVVGETITAEIVGKIGQAIGSEAGHRGQAKIVVGRDCRNSSPELAEALIQGLRDSGRYVVDVGVVPTPVLYFAAHHLEIHSGVMLTGSHNGPEYNGLKIVLDGETLAGEEIQAIYKRIKESDYESGQGTLQTNDVVAEYVRRISEDIPVALGGALKVVVDCGNGVAGAVAPQLIRALGHDVIELYCELDGNFPNHHPDPSQPENLQTLIAKIKEEQADLGLAFDGDGDRLGVVDDQGKIIWPDRQLMLLAKDVLSRNQGAKIIYDVKCSRHLKPLIESSGGEALMWKTGHSLIKAKMKEVDAPLAGEMSGHIFFKERWYGFDDAIYTAARLLEILMKTKAKPSETFAALPEDISTPELRLDLAEKEHQPFMAKLKDKILSIDGAEVIDIDGYRVEFSDGWGLIRPSNTSPCLVLRFEAESQQSLDRIQAEFRTALLSINSDLQLPF